VKAAVLGGKKRRVPEATEDDMFATVDQMRNTALVETDRDRLIRLVREGISTRVVGLRHSPDSVCVAAAHVAWQTLYSATDGVEHQLT